MILILKKSHCLTPIEGNDFFLVAPSLSFHSLKNNVLGYNYIFNHNACVKKVTLQFYTAMLMKFVSTY